MGNCLGTSHHDGGIAVDTSRFSFTRRLDPWEKTGMVAFRNSDLAVRWCFPSKILNVPPHALYVDKQCSILGAHISFK